jgi:hypothetical protein
MYLIWAVECLIRKIEGPEKEEELKAVSKVSRDKDSNEPVDPCVSFGGRPGLITQYFGNY